MGECARRRCCHCTSCASSKWVSCRRRQQNSLRFPRDKSNECLADNKVGSWRLWLKRYLFISHRLNL